MSFLMFPDMKRHIFSTFWFATILISGGLLLGGCGATAPIVDSLNTPDTLQTDENGTFQATIQNEEDADEPLTYTWEFGDGSVASGLRATHRYGSTGEYTVLFRAQNEGGADSAQATVQMVSPPQPANIVSINVTPNPADEGTTVSFTSNVQGDNPMTYNWSLGDGSSETEGSASHKYASAGQYTVRLRAANDAGEDTKTVNVQVNRVRPEICRTVTEMSSAYFNQNSSTLTAEAKASLRENSEILSQCSNVSVRAEGFAAPGERNATSLSADRAEAVAAFYRENGVSRSQITTQGNGMVEGITSKKGGTREYRRTDSILQKE